MYVSAHKPFSTTLFIDMNSIIFGSTKALGLREYEIQSSLEKLWNHNAVTVDQEL
mgnify:CR=1 FL=1